MNGRDRVVDENSKAAASAGEAVLPDKVEARKRRLFGLK
jgi:hypothetical protein